MSVVFLSAFDRAFCRNGSVGYMRRANFLSEILHAFRQRAA
jgi:hypothetical protein